MATFSKPQAASIFDRVPPELATTIFDLATANYRPNAASCRLVFQYFHIHSSPYLVQKIVIGSRLDVLTKVRDILQHPYFSQHVTHLLWDTSYYDETLATEFYSYLRAFNESDHNLAHQDPIFRQWREADGRKKHKLLDSEPLSSSRAPENSEDWLTDQLMRGLHLSFSEYHRRWRSQEKTFSKSGDAGKCAREKLVRHFFLMAIKELPQLRHISYSEYRSLAYEGESYGELCRRLFGDMLCPNLDYSIFYNPMHLEIFLEDLAEHRPILRSLSIGRQPFERSPIEEQSYYSVEVDADPTGNGFTVLNCQSLFPTTNGVGSPKIQAQVLRLPLLYGNSPGRQLQSERESSAPEDIDRLIRNFGTGIVDLEVGSRAFLVEFERSKFQGTLLSYPHVPLNTIIALNLSDLNVLKSLSLRGFKFNVPSLGNGLSKCAKTLRILRLVDCYCRETYDAFESFAKQELASNLSLTGVEIHNLLFMDSHTLDMNLPWESSFRTYGAIICCELASKYGLEGLDSHARTMNHQALKASSVQRGIDLVAGWPYARYELENAMLGGRINTVSRKVRSFLKVHRRDLDVGGKNWWEEPVSYN